MSDLEIQQTTSAACLFDVCGPHWPMAPSSYEPQLSKRSMAIYGSLDMVTKEKML
jgi:hypothetical protein